MKIDSSYIMRIGAVLGGRQDTVLRSLIHPAREWGTSLFVTVFAAIALFGFAGYDFYEQYTDSAMPTIGEEHIPKYRAEDAGFLLRYYEGRQEDFEALREDRPYIPPPVTEPSVVSGEEGGVVAGVEMGG